MKCTSLNPVGARLTDMRVDTLNAGAVEELRHILAEHGVIVLPGQHVDDQAFLRFLRSFGQLTFTVGETPVPGFSDLNVLSNVGRTTPPRSTFHIDTTYVRNPPAYTALRAVQVPRRGGHTLFTNQYLAYASLPKAMIAQLDGRTVTHVVTGLDLDEDAETSAAHPLFRVHPVSGRTALYLTTPKRCAAIEGMAPGDADAAIAYLYGHSTRPQNVYRHAWAPGDVVMWDNGAVMHRADHGGVVGDRIMHRGMVAS